MRRWWCPRVAVVVVLGLVGCGGGNENVRAPEEPASHGQGQGHGHGHGHGDGHGHGHGHGHGGPLVHRFENAEEWAKRFDEPGRDEWQRPADVIAAMRLSEGMSVADLGAGTGYFLSHLSRAVGASGKVIALDVEADMVRYMRERAGKEGLGNVEVKQVPFDDPQLAPSSVDRVLVVDVWHHVDGRKAYAAKLKEALRPGGEVVVVDFTKEARRGPPPEHRLPPEVVVEELSAAGLEAKVIEEPLPDQYIVVGTRK